MHRPRLLTTRSPRRPDGVVVLVHGGAARSGTPAVSATQLSVLRMVPLAQRIARAGRGRLAVVRLLNSTRGWDTAHTPAMDVTWALRQVAERYGDLPVSLVGHSLGARAVLLAGGGPRVSSVVALNAWVHPGDVADLTGRRVLFVHGTDDRVASIERARAVADRISGTTEVTFREVPGGRHAMLRRGRVYESLATHFVASTLLGRALSAD